MINIQPTFNEAIYIAIGLLALIFMGFFGGILYALNPKKVRKGNDT